MVEPDNVGAHGVDWAMETMGADAIDATTGSEDTKSPALWEQGTAGSNPATSTLN